MGMSGAPKISGPTHGDSLREQSSRPSAREDEFLPPVGADPGRADPMIGRTLGKYLIRRKLGAGGMGVVYEAQDTILRRSVAIKLPPPHVSADAEALQRFLHEAQAAASLSHANVVAIYEVNQEHGILYIAMELVRGGSTEDFLRAQGPFDWREATRIVRGACRGLAAAHAAGLIHRDVKPANIMRAGDGSVKLADFGLAKNIDQAVATLSVNSRVVGTPNFMSPEQCGAEPIDDRSDVYSLGATYYALLSGKPPFSGKASLHVMFAHCSSPSPDPREVNPDIPESCVAVVQKAMAKDPADRYQSAVEMLAVVDALLQGASETLVPAGKKTWPSESSPSPPKSTQDLEPVPLPASSTRQRLVRAGPWLVLGILGVWLIVAGFFFFRGKARTMPAPASPGPEVTARNNPVREDEARTIPPEALVFVPPAVDPGHPNAFAAGIGDRGLVLPMGGKVRALAFSPDGKRFAAGNLDDEGGVHIWDATTGAHLSYLWSGRAIHAIAFSPDGKLLAAGGLFGMSATVKLQHLDEGWERTMPADGGAGAPYSLAFSANGRMLAAGFASWRGEDRIFLKLWDPASGRELHRLSEHTAGVDAVAFPPPNSRVLASGSSDGSVRIWNPGKGSVLKSLWMPPRVHALAFAPDGRTLAVATGQAVQFRDTATWSKNQPDWQQHSAVLALAFSPDGTRLAIGTVGRTGVPPNGYLWDVALSKEIGLLPGHQQQISGVAFSPDSKILATGSWDRTVRLWNLSRFAGKNHPAPIQPTAPLFPPPGNPLFRHPPPGPPPLGPRPPGFTPQN